MSTIETRIVLDKEELVNYRKDICCLFEECFQTSMSVELWDWAYLENVFGHPIVAMSFAGRKLVGHYAVIPLALTNKAGDFLKAALSMTTMVAASHRKHHLFTELALKTYGEMVRQDYDIVYGFPNEMSAPGFRKRLGWVLGEPDYVARVTKKDLMESSDLRAYLSLDRRYGFNIQDVAQLNWRISRPGSDYQVDGTYIVKKYEENLDMMYLDQQSIMSMMEGEVYNVLLDSSIKDLKEFKVFEYQFGCRDFKNNHDVLGFDKSMLISDIF